MKYYSEEETQGIRSAFEKEVLLWDQVSTKRMFGCPCYKANERLFSFLVTKGAVITHLNQTDREALALEHGSAFFNTGKKYVTNWPQISVHNVEGLKAIMPYVRKSYELALQEV